MSLTTRRDEVPISVEGVRRSIQKTILEVEKETDLFINEHAKDVGSPEKWMNFINTACRQMNRDPNSLRDYKDLRPILSRVREHESLSEYREEYLDLRRMMERAKLFDFIAVNLREELAHVNETQLERFCLSFFQETKDEELVSVEEYEETIGVCRREIKDRRALVNRLVEEAGQHKDSLSQYISNYTSVLNRMVDACQALAGVCIPMKKWLSADANYTHKIQDEITSYTRRKLDLQEVIKEKTDERKRWQKKVRKASAKIRSLESKLKEFKEEKKAYIRRKADVEQRYIKGDAELSRRTEDLREITGDDEDNEDGQEDSPNMRSYRNGMEEAVRNEVRWAEESLKRMMDQMKGLQRDEKRVQSNMDMVSESIEDSRQNQRAAAERMKKCDEELGYLDADIRFHLSKIRALQKVREVKLHSDTLKKIFHYGYNPELIIDNKDELYEAFRVTAAHIDKDWMTLYLRLPFDPPRDLRERQRDLEVIDLTHRRLDVSYKILALKSLEKWRRLSHLSTLNELLNTLRKMKRDDTIGLIKRRVFRRSISKIEEDEEGAD